MFGQNKEDVKELKAMIERLQRDLEGANEFREAYKKFALGGKSLTEWIGERTKNAQEFLEQKFALDLLKQENELRQQFLVENENMRIAQRDDKIEIARLTTKVEMLEKVIDVGGEVVDIKDLVNKLIAKMPEIKLDNISVNVNAKPEANINN